MKNILRFFLLKIMLLTYIIWSIYKLANSHLLIQNDTIFLLKSGIGSIALSKQLCRKKIVNYSYLFQCLLYLKSELACFKTGTYLLTPNMTIYKMLDLFSNGKEIQIPLRLIEGMRLSDYLNQLHNAQYIKHTLSNDKYGTIAKILKLKDSRWLEGWFWPDTWMYTPNTTDIALLKRSHRKMINIVQQVWNDRAKGLPYKNQNQLVTMASIIEKETAISNERYFIASVFINRLRVNMRLQTDPTVIYGMGYNYTGKISRKDLKRPTAYNTYIINGLPPSPIAIPSLNSLNAAAHPAKTSYFYFVADGKGGHIFNTNLANHNISVYGYIKKFKRKHA